MSERFSAVIAKVGVNPYVDVPERVSAALERTGYIPVRGKVNGAPFTSGLVSLGGGRHRLFVNGEMREAAGVGVGDRIEVELAYDPEPRRWPVPEALADALGEDLEAHAAWEAMTPSRRTEIVRYLDSLKRPETIERGVAKVLRILRDRG